MIRLSNIEKAFSHGVTKTYVLRRIDLNIEQGEFVSIMGPSGAGKSTLLHILGMHDQSWGGEYYFDDVAVHKLNPKKRAELRNRNIGFVFQSYHLLDDQRFLRIWSFRSPIAMWIRKHGNRSSVTRSIGFKLSARRICFPASSPVASSNLWALRAQWWLIPASFSLTSRPAIFTRAREKKLWRCSNVSTTKAQP